MVPGERCLWRVGDIGGACLQGEGEARRGRLRMERECVCVEKEVYLLVVPDEFPCGFGTGGEGVVRRHAVRHEESGRCHALQLHLQPLPVCCANGIC